MDTISGNREQVVACRKIDQRATPGLRTLEVCKECDFHQGIEEVRAPGQLVSEENPKGLPPSYRVACGLPTKIMVIDVIRETKKEN